jgi:hypothetical protein
MTQPSRTVRKIHFDDFGGSEFERLVLAYHVRAAWTDIAWYGQTGSDQGRDIIGTELFDGELPRRTVIQCVNRGSLTQKKAEADLAAAIAAPTGVPDAFKFVTRTDVSAIRRDAIKQAAKNLGINYLTIWSGAEFEEHLRLRGEDLLRRFCAGESFPDKADEIQRFVDDFGALADNDILDIMAAVFDRPAFRTPFHEESSLPAFQQAIEDTIAALNTGIWRTREGNEIRRIPSLHHLRDPRAKAKVSHAVQLVDNLRRQFVSGLRSGRIKPRGCGNSDCPVFLLQSGVATELDHIRSQALDAFRGAHASFNQRQYKRKPARCHLITVPGLTIASASRTRGKRR